MLKSPTKVALISPIIPDYKVHVYEALNKTEDLVCMAFHGFEGKGIYPKDVGRQIKIPDRYVKNLYVKVRGRIFLIFQFLIRDLWRFDPDVIIMQDGLKIISNYLVLLYGYLCNKRIIWYTHGRNRQAKKKGGLLSRSLERARLSYLRRSDAIIAYTEGTKSYLEDCGVDGSRIFVALNTLDVEKLIKLKNQISSEDLDALKNEIVAPYQRVVTFVGRVVPEKRFDYFVNLMKHLDRCHPQRYLGLVIGDGILLPGYEQKIADESISNIRFLGRISIEESMKYLMLSDLIFIPGMTGLAIVHAFCCGVPYVTLDHDIHSPEIEYLQHGRNGLLTSRAEYISDILRLLETPEELQKMGSEALKTAVADLDVNKQTSGFYHAIRYAAERSLSDSLHPRLSTSTSSSS